LADKPEPPPTDEPRAPEDAKTPGQALREMGFLPLANPPPRIIVRSGKPGRPLKLGRIAEEQG